MTWNSTKTMGNCNRKPDSPGRSDDAAKARKRSTLKVKAQNNKESDDPAVSNNDNDDAKSDISSLTMVTMVDLGVSKRLLNEDEQYLGEFDLQPSEAALIDLEIQESLRQQAIERVGQKGSDLDLIEKKWKNDKDVVLIAVTNNGRALQYASETLRTDKEVVLAAVTNYAAALEYASNALKSDVEVVEAAVKNNGLALVHSSDLLKADTNIVTIAIKANGSALEYATDEIRRDKKMVLLAVENNPSSLKFAMDGLREDKDCLHAAGLRDNEDCEQKNEVASIV